MEGSPLHRVRYAPRVGDAGPSVSVKQTEGKIGLYCVVIFSLFRRNFQVDAVLVSWLCLLPILVSSFLKIESSTEMLDEPRLFLSS